MTGRVISEIFPTIRSKPGRELLRVEGLSTERGTVIDASLEVRAGEVVGLAGLIGSGKSEIMRAVFGLDAISGGRITLKGEDVTGQSPRGMMERGFFYVPPDRRGRGPGDDPVVPGEHQPAVARQAALLARPASSSTGAAKRGGPASSPSA